MKIDAYRVDAERAEQAKTAATRAEEARTASRPGGPSAEGDQVNLSWAVRLISSARMAVDVAPDVRSEAVARGRALLESGSLGQNADRLADALLDGTIDRE